MERAGYAVRLRDIHRPAAEHWRFGTNFAPDRGAVEGKTGCSAVGFFSGRGTSACIDLRRLRGHPAALRNAEE